MKQSLQKKLKSYSALAGALAATGSVNAQIIYTDVAPDVTATAAGSMGIQIDLDNGGTVDFTLGANAGVTSSGYAYNQVLAAVPQNSVNAISQNGVIAGYPLNAVHNNGDVIGSALTWAADTVQFVARVYPASTSYNFGNWVGATDKYFGFRFMLGANTHYGWARVDVAADGSSFTLKDYAYESTPNTQILAGAMPTPTSVNEKALNGNARIFSSNKNIHVNLNNAAVEGIITVTNVLGQEVASVAVTNQTSIISMENAVAGIYFVTVMQNSEKFTQKVIVR